MCRETFISLLDREFDQFITKGKKIVTNEKEYLFGFSFLSISHDMWTTMNNDNVLGCSM
jgi:hypothetical protein